MKKSSFLLGAAALMLATACSNDEVVKVAENGAAIGFSSFVNNSTRTTELSTYNAINDLKVWGVTYKDEEIAATEIFAGQIVEKKGAAAGSGVWTYEPARYWVADNAYSFAAIAPANAVEKGLTVDQDLNGEWSEAGLILTFDNEKAEAALDLLYATKDVDKAKADNPAVALDLKHMLSRVRFQFENGLNVKEGETIEIVDLQIIDATQTADITKAEATGTWSNPKGTFAVKFPVKAEETTANIVTTDHKYLIPLTAAQNYKIKFTVNLLQNGNKVASYVHDGEGGNGISLGDVAFVNNYSYTFKTTVDYSNINEDEEMNKIEFTVDVTKAWDDWSNEDSNKDYTLPTKPVEGE